MSLFGLYPSLAGRVALVTGGASGIGAAIVEHLAAQRAHVGFIDVDPALAQSMLHPAAGRLHFEQSDVRDVGQLQAAVARVRAALGPIQILVNNAARDDRHTVEEVTPAYWDERIAVNLRHQFFASQAVVGDMAQCGGGSIINLGSASWMLGQGGMPVYLTAKAAIVGLTRALARDLGERRIRVNSVVPGWVMTERQRQLWMSPEAEAELLRSQCLKELLLPADVARMVLWLASEDSRLVTSQSFVVDAGRT